MSSTKTLIILRHGEAKTAGIGEVDANRPLTEAGKKDAKNSGLFLSENAIKPDFALCSPAIRTRQTLEEIQKSFPAPIPTEYHPKIYHASDRDLLALLASTPENVQNLLLIGHNPALHQLAIALAKSGDEKLIHNLYMRFPPCTMAVFSLNNSWNELGKNLSKSGVELKIFRVA